MLEVNPDLTWRDVKSILKLTAQVVLDPEDDTRVINAANISHSNKYGFGIVNAEAAVNMSESWVNLPEERVLVYEGEGIIPLTHRDEGGDSSGIFYFGYPTPFVVETVTVRLKLNHTSRGHLRISLTSPGDTISVLTPGDRPEDQRDEWMSFTTVRHWGESPHGLWTIRGYDTVEGDVSNCSDYRWNWVLSDEAAELMYVEEEDDRHVQCEHHRKNILQYFCNDGAINPNGTIATQCDAGDEKSCNILDEFLNFVDKGKNAAQACCLCGGGEHPDSFPDFAFAWKVEISGYNKYNDFFSGVRDDAGFGTGGLRANTNGAKFDEFSARPGMMLSGILSGDETSSNASENSTLDAVDAAQNTTSQASCPSLSKSLCRHMLEF